jgi:hypothetical protein
MGKRYLYPAPPPDATLLESDTLGLVMPESVFNTLDLSPWRKAEVHRLPVLDAPLDGFGQLLNP